MLRTINFTGRRKIPREAAQISLCRDTEGEVVFEAVLDFSQFDFPPGSQVFIEAYFKTATERFGWGTTDAPAVPTERRLRKLAQPELASFRVKVVEPAIDGPGRLLGVADEISPTGLRSLEKRRIALFRVNPIDELVDEIWRLDLSDSNGPILDLNRSVAGIKEQVRGETFMALVFPAVMREIYQRIFSEGYHDPDDDRDGWQARWLRFGTQLTGQAPPAVSEETPGAEHQEWTMNVIGVWSRRQKIVPNFKRTFSNTEGVGK